MKSAKEVLQVVVAVLLIVLAVDFYHHAIAWHRCGGHHARSYNDY